MTEDQFRLLMQQLDDVRKLLYLNICMTQEAAYVTSGQMSASNLVGMKAELEKTLVSAGKLIERRAPVDPAGG